ncbi:MAG TPA: CPXCG motif-containing cysteine-rich protein [Steroidobacteraceae bacterium]|nr:CPXCG motif-containing cysteine-rich protein [Steroidobacteraceae bacterium]
MSRNRTRGSGTARNARNNAPGEVRNDDRSIDEIYGLEPVLEPGAVASGMSAGQGVQFERVECPYCGECFETQIDASAGATSYVEDCQVCCQPIQFMLEVDAAGGLSAVTVHRSDD